LDQLIKSFRAQYVYLVSIIIFEAGSILCAAAPTSAALILGRVIAGCGAAGIIQGTLTILGYSVPKKQVPLYYEYVLSVQGISACTSPIIGGIFTERVNWRWCFWVNVPIGAIALLMVLLLVKPKTSHEALWSLPALECLKQMDWIGTLIFRAAFTCLFFALQWGGQTKP
jgi:MFS family permease